MLDEEFWWKVVLINCGVVAVGMLVAVVVIGVKACISSHGMFTYTTANGETGNARMCYTGYGHMVCYLDGGETVQVQKYRRTE